jgi:hypothetical protein
MRKYGHHTGEGIPKHSDAIWKRPKPLLRK